MRPALSEREHRLIGELLSERVGLQFGPEKRDILRSRLEPRRMELGFESFEQLYFHLKFHPEREREWERLLPHLTNNESYFFREPAQLDVLREEILATVKQRLQRSGREEVRILSAGCAAGEEPYTLAILLRQSRIFPPSWRVRVTGMDVDPSALERARQGIYTRNAFRRIPPEVRSRHFTELDGERWQLDPDVRQLVSFVRGNLVDPEWVRRVAAQDVIFCRNVLIYFGEESTREAVEGFYRALAPGGYLFLGHAETLSRIPTRFVAERRPGAVFYRRPEVEDA